MGKSSRKKVADHPDLLPNEHVIDACWGMGRGMLKAADLSGKMFLTKALSDKPGYTDELDAATTGGAMASRIAHNGMFVLTDKRLLWMEVKTAVRKPKSVSAAFELGDIADIAYEKPILAVAFSDGSRSGIHAADHPEEFVAAWTATQAG
jgi:hypothetical protein